MSNFVFKRKKAEKYFEFKIVNGTFVDCSQILGELYVNFSLVKWFV